MRQEWDRQKDLYERRVRQRFNNIVAVSPEEQRDNEVEIMYREACFDLSMYPSGAGWSAGRRQFRM